MPPEGGGEVLAGEETWPGVLIALLIWNIADRT